MKEDTNSRIIKKLQGGTYRKNVSVFLADAIREEFEKRELTRWNFKETYDRLIERYAEQENLEK